MGDEGGCDFCKAKSAMPTTRPYYIVGEWGLLKNWGYSLTLPEWGAKNRYFRAMFDFAPAIAIITLCYEIFIGGSS